MHYFVILLFHNIPLKTLYVNNIRESLNEKKNNSVQCLFHCLCDITHRQFCYVPMKQTDWFMHAYICKPN